MSRLVFFLEEPSARNFLRNFLPVIGFRPEEYQICRPYQGKQDLLKHFAADLRGWRSPNDRFLVLVDQDREDCRQLKEEKLRATALEKCQMQAGKLRVRIACYELEAWYLGDVSALRVAYPGVREREWRKIPKTEDPDDLEKPSSILEQVIPQFRKTLAAEEMGKALGCKCAESPAYYAKGGDACNSSASFRCFAATMSGFLRELRGE